jgi:hypothetical protein
MRLIIILLGSCFLFPSCFSYKKVDLATHKIENNKKYRIQTKELKNQKIKIIETNDNTISFIKKGDKITLSISSIEGIKKRKFSYLKTLGVTVVIVGVVGIFEALDNLSPEIGDIPAPN